MEAVVYPGCSKKQLEIFPMHVPDKEMEIITESDYFGTKVIFKADFDFAADLAVSITRFIVEVHLRDYILSKIYDEYQALDEIDSSSVLGTIVCELPKCFCFRRIEDILRRYGKFNVSSYIIFNIKIIMLTINSVVDKFCEQLVYEKERCAFASMLRTYAVLSGSSCALANVEFADENIVAVTIDNSRSVNINKDELISYLAGKAPQKIEVYNSELCPQLAKIISEFFPDTELKQ